MTAPEHWWDDVPEGRREQIRVALREDQKLFEADSHLLLELIERLEKQPKRKGPDGFWVDCELCDTKFLTTDATRTACGRCATDQADES